MEHGQRREIAIALMGIRRGTEGHQRPHGGGVRVHNALWQTGRARGVHDVEQVIRFTK